MEWGRRYWARSEFMANGMENQKQSCTLVGMLYELVTKLWYLSYIDGMMHKPTLLAMAKNFLYGRIWFILFQCMLLPVYSVAYYYLIPKHKKNMFYDFLTVDQNQI